MLSSEGKDLLAREAIDGFWITNGSIRIKLLNQLIVTITHEVDLEYHNLNIYFFME